MLKVAPVLHKPKWKRKPNRDRSAEKKRDQSRQKLSTSRTLAMIEAEARRLGWVLPGRVIPRHRLTDAGMCKRHGLPVDWRVERMLQTDLGCDECLMELCRWRP